MWFEIGRMGCVLGVCAVRIVRWSLRRDFVWCEVVMIGIIGYHTGRC